MKHIKFSKKTIILLSALVIVILFSTFYLGAASSVNNTTNGGVITTYTESSPSEKQKYDKEIELERILCDYDKKNIVETWVFFATSDDEIIGANILIVSNEEITDSAEKDELVSLASENLNLDIQNIEIKYMDVETFTSSEKVSK